MPRLSHSLASEGPEAEPTDGPDLIRGSTEGRPEPRWLPPRSGDPRGIQREHPPRMVSEPGGKHPASQAQPGSPGLAAAHRYVEQRADTQLHAGGAQSEGAVPSTGLQPRRKAASCCEPRLHQLGTGVTDISRPLSLAGRVHVRTRLFLSSLCCFLINILLEKPPGPSPEPPFCCYPAARSLRESCRRRSPGAGHARGSSCASQPSPGGSGWVNPACKMQERREKKGDNSRFSHFQRLWLSH